jgi:probable F420-dependent oxidoreductase
MKVGVFQIAPNESADAALVAKHAEDLGFESYWTADHTILPVKYSVPYPGVRHGEGDPEYLWQMPDPLITLARAGGATTRINLGTGIVLVPERNAILTGKQIASLDAATGGRFLFGIGAGWNPEECAILGGDFEHRWSQVKDHILAMKELWTKDISEYHGKYVDFPPVRCFPKPARKPHPPVLFGSVQNERAFKRIVEWGDGWLPLVQDVAEFGEGVQKIKQLAKAAGRDPESFDFTAFGLEGQWGSRDQIDALQKAGAGRVTIWLTADTRDAILKEIDGVAKKLGVGAAVAA